MERTSGQLLKNETVVSQLRMAGQAMACGKMVLWNLHTPGLALNGFDEDAIMSLRQAKRIPVSNSDRPFVSMVPHRMLLRYVDPNKHTPAVQRLLRNPDELLDPDGRGVFYKFYARDHLNRPVVKIEDNGQKTMVLLVQNYPLLRELYIEGMRAFRSLKKSGQKSAVPDFIISGSSANPTGKPSPLIMDDVDAGIMAAVSCEIDLRMPGMGVGQIPIIDLTGNEPHEEREGWYPTGQLVFALLRYIRQLEQEGGIV